MITNCLISKWLWDEWEIFAYALKTFARLFSTKLKVNYTNIVIWKHYGYFHYQKDTTKAREIFQAILVEICVQMSFVESWRNDQASVYHIPSFIRKWHNRKVVEVPGITSSFTILWRMGRGRDMTISCLRKSLCKSISFHIDVTYLRFFWLKRNYGVFTFQIVIDVFVQSTER